ncbi:arginyl-tRNA synthetase [Thraustotheca clavata]|uniref:Large ribosomal subunit protein uL1c n=1 Tax=Thraustotheca clavata TaxID=74557 RepID=A0A1V9YH79_9STRA|nr:arginyl-tRNA synthetase [Thraustotheca clavata]
MALILIRSRQVLAARGVRSIALTTQFPETAFGLKPREEKKPLLALPEALTLCKDNAVRKFDETVDIVVELGVDPRKPNQSVRGVVTLPNGTGKTIRVAVFAKGEKAEEAKAAGATLVGAEDLVADVQAGKLEFDRCIATPDMMALVGRVARVLGPRGLMPNPKLGTVTQDITAAIQAAKGGQVEFRAEKKGIVHAGVGKVSFSDDALIENIRAFMVAIGDAKPEGAKGKYIKAMHLSSTMGPGIRFIDMLRVYQRRSYSISVQSLLQDTLLASGNAQFTLQNTLFRRSHQPNIDYQSSVVLSLGLPKNERVPTAQAIAGQLLEKNNGMLENAIATAPGFINVSLKSEWIAKHVLTTATTGVTPRQAQNKQKILVDFGSPNMGKELHVGHLRSSVLGDTICNLLEFQGHSVSRVSHVGDLGSAIATLLVQAMDDTDNTSLSLPSSEFLLNASASASDLGKWYERGKQRLTSDPAFKTKVDEVVLDLQQEESQWKPQWEKTCEISRRAFDILYKRLNVNVNERGEATYLKLIPAVLESLISAKLAVESQGALCIFIDGPEKSPMLIRKQDGGFLYATTDLATLYSRIYGEPSIDPIVYDRVIYVTDLSQSLHFRHLFEAAKLAGWLNDRNVQLDHVGFGLVLGEDGTKLSSRKGGSTSLEALLNKAGLESSQRSVVQDADHSYIGDAAVRYYDLAQHRERNYKFSYNSVLNLKGNTAVYLMYATARLEGIRRKAGLQDKWDTLLNEPNSLSYLLEASETWTASERALALVLSQFEDALIESSASWHPHLLCDYLFRVTTNFHAFYEACRVQNNPSRLVLCAATDAVLRRGLALVGISAIDRM